MAYKKENHTQLRKYVIEYYAKREIRIPDNHLFFLRRT